MSGPKTWRARRNFEPTAFCFGGILGSALWHRVWEGGHRAGRYEALATCLRAPISPPHRQRMEPVRLGGHPAGGGPILGSTPVGRALKVALPDRASGAVSP